MNRMLIAVAALSALAQDRPRVFITESASTQLAGDATVGESKGSLLLTGGTSPQNVEVLKQFTRHCPQVTITSNREKADYVVRFDHAGASPVTPFFKDNKVAVFNRNEDLVYSGSTRFLANAVKDTCNALLKATSETR